MAGHEGGLHPQGGYRTADLPKEKTEKKELGRVERIVVTLLGLPIIVMIAVGLVAVCIKFTQVCLEWIS
jgi:hypothetical protein